MSSSSNSGYGSAYAPAVSKWLIDPRTSFYIAPWDGLTAVALIFTAIVTPLEVSFLRAPEKVDSLFVLNRVVDLIFLGDMIVQLFLMYKDKPSLNGGGPDSARWVTSHRQIVLHYLKGWFALDFFSILVSLFDIIALVNAYNDDGGGSTALSKFTAFRIIRILRLVKLMRLVRASRLYTRWEARLAINYGTLALIKAMCGVILVGHWFACIWSLQTEIAIAIGNEEALVESWKFAGNFCFFLDPEEMDLDATSYVVSTYNDEVACDPPGRLYVASLYWSMMTITSIGYGDITPRTTYEYIVSVVLMLAGGATWGTVIATFCGVLASRDAGLAEFRQTMDDLNQFVKIQGFPRELAVRLREYFNQTKHLQMASSHRTLLRMMSPSLQGEVALRCNERWLRRVWFLADAEPEFMVQVALNLNAMVFAPGELAASNHLYIVHRGLALYGGRVLTAGRVWGEDMILMSAHLRTRYCARAMNYLEVYMIGREDLLELAAHFPQTWRSIRRHAVRLALRREFVRQAQLRRQVDGETADERPSLSLLFESASYAPSSRDPFHTLGAAPPSPVAAGSVSVCRVGETLNDKESPTRRRRNRGGRGGGKQGASASWKSEDRLSHGNGRATASHTRLSAIGEDGAASRRHWYPPAPALKGGGSGLTSLAPPAQLSPGAHSPSETGMPPIPPTPPPAPHGAAGGAAADAAADAGATVSGEEAANEIRTSLSGGGRKTSHSCGGGSSASPRNSSARGSVTGGAGMLAGLVDQNLVDQVLAAGKGGGGSGSSDPSKPFFEAGTSIEQLEKIRQAAAVSAAFVAGRVQDVKADNKAASNARGGSSGAQSRFHALRQGLAGAPAPAASAGASSEQIGAIKATQAEHSELLAQQAAAMRSLTAAVGEIRDAVAALGQQAQQAQQAQQQDGRRRRRSFGSGTGALSTVSSPADLDSATETSPSGARSGGSALGVHRN